MNRVRPIVVLALGAAVVTGLHAEAATSAGTTVKKVCYLVRDASGDANGVNFIGSPVPTENAGPSSDTLDITSVDLASNATTLTGVIRVKKLSASDTSAPTGAGWQINFLAPNNQQLSLLASVDPSGKPSFGAGYLDPTSGSTSVYGADTSGVKGKFLPTKNAIHISVPLSTFVAQAPLKSGDTLSGISAFSGQNLSLNDPTGAFGGGLLLGDSNDADDASGGKNYVMGTASCVVPGK